MSDLPKPCESCGQIHSPEADRKQGERTLSVMAVAAALAAADEMEKLESGLSPKQLELVVLRSVEHFCLAHGAQIARVLGLLGSAKLAEIALSGRNPTEWLEEQAKLIRPDVLTVQVSHLVKKTDGTLN